MVFYLQLCIRSHCRIYCMLYDGIVSATLRPTTFFLSPPYGVPILNSKAKSLYPARLSSFNCTGSIILGPNRPEPLSVHLGNCQFTSNIPSACKEHRRDVAIVCLEPYDMGTFSTPPPVTFAPVTCKLRVKLPIHV